VRGRLARVGERLQRHARPRLHSTRVIRQSGATRPLSRHCRARLVVIAGLDPAIQRLKKCRSPVDHRAKPGDDVNERSERNPPRNPKWRKSNIASLIAHSMLGSCLPVTLFGLTVRCKFGEVMKRKGFGA